VLIGSVYSVMNLEEEENSNLGQDNKEASVNINKRQTRRFHAMMRVPAHPPARPRSPVRTTHALHDALFRSQIWGPNFA
jgi:hypothetical protein